MNRRRRRPLKLHLRAAPPGEKVAFRSSPKVSLKIILPGVLLGLIMAAALGFTAVTLLKNARMKHQGATALASPSATASPLLAGTANPVPTAISSPPAPLVSGTPVSSPPAPLVSPTPVSSPPATPTLRPSASARGSGPKEAKTPPEVDRKLAEQRRREAERKRARLEILHKDHQISEEAYKQGQEEYQAEMAKYRSVVAGGHPTNQSQ